MPVIAAVVSVVLTAVLAWFIGTRITYGWDEVKRQRESDLAALKSFYECYGKFFAAWKMWDVYLKAAPSGIRAFPATDPTAWALLRDAEAAEGGFESILVKLAAEYATSEQDRLLLASFRQGAQSLREAMRSGQALSWKAQPTSVDRPGDQERRRLDYRKYRAFKALCEYVAVRLAQGPAVPHRWYWGRRSRDRDQPTVLLGSRPQRPIDEMNAVAALIEITQVQNIGGRWYEIAEDAFGLPEV
ncbi:hypothetical protein DMB66_38410 [Actinoplanes sp. ATCC 53533]|uniref:hypothetical protein n=1 Tax=Actinoplanes sp. ATCC 53533 TaxID=1288362 RepID=UPI000F7A3940|nr:hypothetical protein [Actinoplanes sp. ATCC 53533]RSM53683.1 hypothetical protein DMB66_38410 [Actinoplanes sp. ATCC 53533]